MGGGRCSFHFPFNLRTRKRAIEGESPSSLTRLGRLDRGLAWSGPGDWRKGCIWGTETRFWSGTGSGEMEAEGGHQRAISGWGKLVLFQPGGTQRPWMPEGPLCAPEQPWLQSASPRCSVRVLRRRRGVRGQKRRTVSAPLPRLSGPHPQRSA